MPRRRPVGARYAYFVEIKVDHGWIKLTRPIFGRTRIAARRQALDFCRRFGFRALPTRFFMRVKGIRIRMRHPYSPSSP